MSNKEHILVKAGNWLTRKPILLSFTFLFCIIAVIAFFPTVLAHKGFVSTTDGLSQQLTTFIDVGSEARAALYALVFEGVLPSQYDLSVGYGAPRSYRLDPVYLFSIICPARYAEHMFTFVVLLKLWFAGVAFIVFSRSLKLTKGATLIAALSYSFSSMALLVFQQTGFVNYWMYFPLVAYGALQLLRTGRPWAYILSSAFFCYVLGLYGTYTAQLLIAVFVLAYLAVVEGAKPGAWIKTVLVFAAAFMVALALSAPTFVGDYLTLSGQDRLAIERATPIFYEPYYYHSMLGGFLGLYYGLADWYFGYGAIALVSCLAVFFIGDKTARVLRVLLIVGIIFLAFPIFGSAFNGFSYAANRWDFGFGLVVACCVGIFATNGFTLPRRGAAGLVVLMFAYTCALVFLPSARWLAVDIQLVVSWVIVIGVLVLSGVVKLPTLGSSNGRRTLVVGIAVLSCLALAFNYALYLSDYGKAQTDRTYRYGSAIKRGYTSVPTSMVAEANKGMLYRFDKSYDINMHSGPIGLNSAKLFDEYGIDFYHSFYNNSVDRFHGELALAGTDHSHSYGSLDSRSALLQVLGVKYFLVRDEKGSDMPLPYTIGDAPLASMKAGDKRDYSLYELNGAQPVAIPFDRVFSHSYYEGLEPIERQELLLQGVVLEDADIPLGEAAKTGTFEPSSQRADYSVVFGENTRVDNGALVVEKDGSWIELDFEPNPHSESYLYVEELELESKSRPKSFAVTIACDVSKGEFKTLTPEHQSFGGRSTWLWNLGYSESGISKARLTFEKAGTYSFADFAVVCQPMKSFDLAQERMRDESVGKLVWDKASDTLSGSVSANDNAYLFLSVPYDRGWGATVNGKPVQVYRANTAFMAIELPEGESEFVLKFSSANSWLWLVTLIAGFGVAVAWFKYGRKRAAIDKC